MLTDRNRRRDDDADRRWRSDSTIAMGFDDGDLDERMERSKSIGIGVMSIGRTPIGGYVHLDTTAVGGTVIELIQRAGRRA